MADMFSSSSLEPLQTPFNVALAPQDFDTPDAPSQEVAMASMLMAPSAVRTNSREQFFNERVQPIQLNQLHQLYQEN